MNACSQGAGPPRVRSVTQNRGKLNHAWKTRSIDGMRRSPTSDFPPAGTCRSRMLARQREEVEDFEVRVA